MARAWRTVSCPAKWLGLGIGVAIVIFLVLLNHKSVPPAVQVDPAAGRRLEVQLRQAEANAFNGASQVLQVGEGELNSIIYSQVLSGRSAIAQGSEAVVRDVKIRLMDDRARVYIVLNAYGKDINVDIEGRVYTQNGFIQFDPLSGRIGLLPIPRSTMQSAVREIMNSPEDHEDLRLPAYLKDLRVEGGKIVLTYR